MGAAYFYHLTRRPLEAVLPTLLEKSLERGWRILVRGTHPQRLAALDEALWTYSDDAFLPHGLAGGPSDAAQPILLSTDPGLPEGRTCLLSVDWADVTASEVAVLDRVSILFDGDDAAALEKARAQWRDFANAGVAAQYWSEESGRWEKKAESG